MPLSRVSSSFVLRLQVFQDRAFTDWTAACAFGGQPGEHFANAFEFPHFRIHARNLTERTCAHPGAGDFDIDTQSEQGLDRIQRKTEHLGTTSEAGPCDIRITELPVAVVVKAGAGGAARRLRKRPAPFVKRIVDALTPACFAALLMVRPLSFVAPSETLHQRAESSG